MRLIGKIVNCFVVRCITRNYDISKLILTFDERYMSNIIFIDGDIGEPFILIARGSVIIRDNSTL